MGSGLKGSTRFLLGGMAAAGVVAAHLLAYLFAVPDPHHRALVLESTGHRAWSYVTALALGLLVAGLLRFIVGGLRGAGECSALRSYLTVAGRLVVLQLGCFVGIEALERIGVDRSVAGLLSEPAVLLGLLLQVAIAFLGAALLLVLARAIETVLAKRRRRPIAQTAPRPITRTRSVVRRLAVGTGGGTLRGPPLLLI